MAFIYEISDSFEVKIFNDAEKGNAPLIIQPENSNGMPFKSADDAEAWALNCIEDIKNNLKMFDSWTWDNVATKWVPPIPFPNDDKIYDWDDENQSWVEVTE